VKKAPEPTMEDVIFLLQQLDIIEHSQDRDRIAIIAKKYNIHTISNHRGKLGKGK
jgi:predicted transcriptional regulator